MADLTSNSGSIHKSDARAGLAYRGQVVSRLLAALAGGYVLANVAAILLARVLHLAVTSRADGVLFAVLFSFVVYPAAVLWAFAVRSATRAWLGLLAVSLVCAALAWLTGGGNWIQNSGVGS